ncbi:prostaglandin E synthase 3-like [Synchiropus picturatus]
MATQPAAAKWYDRRDSVFIEFCVEDSREVCVAFDKSKINFSCITGSKNVKQQNSLDLFGDIDPEESKHRHTQRSVVCCLRKAEAGRSWPRLTKEKTKCNWLSLDFNNWKDWEEESEDDLSSFDRFSEIMNTMGGDDLPDLDEVKKVTTCFTAGSHGEALTVGPLLQPDGADSDEEKALD